LRRAECGCLLEQLQTLQPARCRRVLHVKRLKPSQQLSCQPAHSIHPPQHTAPLPACPPRAHLLLLTPSTCPCLRLLLGVENNTWLLLSKHGAWQPQLTGLCCCCCCCCPRTRSARPLRSTATLRAIDTASPGVRRLQRQAVNDVGCTAHAPTCPVDTLFCCT
jgi:hypothetical protein